MLEMLVQLEGGKAVERRRDNGVAQHFAKDAQLLLRGVLVHGGELLRTDAVRVEPGRAYCWACRSFTPRKRLMNSWAMLGRWPGSSWPSAVIGSLCCPRRGIEHASSAPFI